MVAYRLDRARTPLMEPFLIDLEQAGSMLAAHAAEIWFPAEGARHFTSAPAPSK
jgi:hypothetical protein